MPPRRPGGKYKGMISREKSEAHYAAEFEKAQKKQMQKYLRTLAEGKNRVVEEVAREQADSADNELRLKIITMLFGTRKLLKSTFTAWTQGMWIMRRESNMKLRDKAWRASCIVCGSRTGCGCHEKLTDVGFRMPYDIACEISRRVQEEEEARDRAARFEETRRRPLPLPPLVSVEMGRQCHPTRSKSLVDLEQPSRSHWPCRCAQCRSGKSHVSHVGPGFMNLEQAKVRIHHRTGRRVLLDADKMRFCFDDVLKKHAADKTSII